MQDRLSRALSATALFVAAIVSGAFAGFVVAVFVWCYEHGVEVVWGDLPEALDVDPFGSWFTIVVPVVGGALVGIVHLVVGDHPRPMEEAVATWKSGGRLEPDIVPRVVVASLVILLLGGPVGFEAAIVGVAGGMAAFTADRVRSAGGLVRQVWGADRVESLPASFVKAPLWVAAIASLIAYRWMPFGGIDLGFRYDRFDQEWGVGDAAAAFGFAALITGPAIFAMRTVVRAERSTIAERSPIVFGMVGGLAFALLALGNEIVLFSGQMQFQALPGQSNAELLYVTVAKYAALLIALVTGWRGGPIFPLFTSVGALAIVAADLVDIPFDIVAVAGLAAVSTIVVRGNVPLAMGLTLYVAPVSYGFVMVIGCVGATVVLAIARTAGIGDDDARTDDGTVDAGTVAPTT